MHCWLRFIFETVLIGDSWKRIQERIGESEYKMDGQEEVSQNVFDRKYVRTLRKYISDK